MDLYVDGDWKNIQSKLAFLLILELPGCFFPLGPPPEFAAVSPDSFCRASFSWLVSSVSAAPAQGIVFGVGRKWVKRLKGSELLEMTLKRGLQ